MMMMDSDDANVLASVICNKPSCSNFIFDFCELCESDYCRECIDNHDCGQSSSSVPKSSAQDETCVDHLPPAQDSISNSSTVTLSLASTTATTTISLGSSKKSANLAIASNKGNVKRRFFDKKGIEKESLKNLHAERRKYDPKDMKFTASVQIANASWVWQHFRKFNHTQHPELKEHACCIHCFEAAKENQNIIFTVLYTVCLKAPLFIVLPCRSGVRSFISPHPNHILRTLLYFSFHFSFLLFSTSYLYFFTSLFILVPLFYSMCYNNITRL